MNDFIDAIKNNDESEDDGNAHDESQKRYNKLKREKADVDKKSPAKRRYQKLKDKAKQEMIEKHRENDEEEEQDDGEEFITH
jgi:hypothetical protein